MKVDRVDTARSPYVYIEVDEIEPYLEKVEAAAGASLYTSIPEGSNNHNALIFSSRSSTEGELY